jgi:hypothetical protein
MSPAQTLSANDVAAPVLAHEILKYLEAEYEHLLSVMGQLDEIHEGLKRGELETFYKGQGSPGPESSPTPTDPSIFAARVDLRGKLSRILSRSESNVTIEQYARTLLSGPLQREVLAARFRVLELSHRIDRRSRQNGMIVLHSLRILQDAVESASGASRHTPIYDHDGVTSPKFAHATFNIQV